MNEHADINSKDVRKTNWGHDYPLIYSSVSFFDIPGILAAVIFPDYHIRGRAHATNAYARLLCVCINKYLSEGSKSETGTLYQPLSIASDQVRSCLGKLYGRWIWKRSNR